MKDTNRIDHFAWAVHPENAEAYVAQLSELFDTTFEELKGATGARILISWDTGLEIATPVGEGTGGDIVRAHLEKYGEGPFALVFRVPDIEAAGKRAAKLGWPVDTRALGDEVDMTWTNKLTSLHERIIGPFLNTMLLYGQIDYVEDDRKDS